MAPGGGCPLSLRWPGSAPGAETQEAAASREEGRAQGLMRGAWGILAGPSARAGRDVGALGRGGGDGSRRALGLLGPGEDYRRP